MLTSYVANDTYIVSNIHGIEKGFTYDSSPTRARNCRQFIACGTLYRGGLPLTRQLRYRSYKCCIYCDSFAKATWERLRVKIEGWYDEISLRKGKPLKQENGYCADELETGGVSEVIILNIYI
jgi:hypothetical protein